jgi:uncharacterized RDD family membrane protein YckC
MPTYPTQAPAAGGWQSATPGTTPDGVPLAGFGQRVLAYIVDVLIMMVPQLLLSSPFLVLLFRVIADNIDDLERAETLGEPVDPLWIYGEPGFWGAAIGITAVGLLVSAAYSIGFLATRGATPGKSLVGLRVRSWATEARPTWRQATQRWLSGVVPATLVSLYFYLDVLWPLWDQRRQALHDKWPGTVVVKKTG